ncbi:MAG: hypothetical protein IPN03_23105 [Holophagales bacterium]|nr:hypothetical protein [Holophagales bacterium]
MAAFASIVVESIAIRRPFRIFSSRATPTTHSNTSRCSFSGRFRLHRDSVE